MKTSAVRMLARPSFVLYAACAVLALLSTPPGAWAEGRVAFYELHILKCEDFGECEWKVSCGVEGQPQAEVTADGKAGRSVKLEQTLDLKTFPATLRCTLSEDDGIFGESWSQAAEGTVTIPAGGDYKMILASPDQGSVRVEFSVDSLEIAVAPPPPAPAVAATPPGKAPAKGAKKPAAPPAPLQYVGVFNPRPEGAAVVVGLDQAAFKARVSELDGHGLKLVALDTFMDGDKRLWSGIFRKAEDEIILVTGVDWDAFIPQWKRMSAGSRRLVDFEIYNEGSKAMFAALYRGGSDTYSLWVGQERDKFLPLCKELASIKGLKVNDLEIYQQNGKTLYAAAYRGDVAQPELWTALDRPSFESKWAQGKGKGMQLVDVETYTEGGKRLYDATVRTEEPGELVLAPDQAAFVKSWREMLGKGLRLVDLETFRE
ncbi:MAG TPA: hypothetical protein VLQ45_09440 [Thermoanaerobaculia bacterium]|nr:hypothetical protein [Thermoanaerobaculia bacterium]